MERLTQKQAREDLRAYKNGEYSYSALIRKYRITGGNLNSFDSRLNGNFNVAKLAYCIVKGWF